MRSRPTVVAAPNCHVEPKDLTLDGTHVKAIICEYIHWSSYDVIQQAVLLLEVRESTEPHTWWLLHFASLSLSDSADLLWALQL